MQIVPYLTFNGNCEEAFRFYEKHIGGKIAALMRYSEAPQGMPVEAPMKNKIMHGRLYVGDAVLMGSDAPPSNYATPQGFSVTLMTETPAEAERVFRGLSEGGNVTMTLQETFFAEKFAMLVDRFGTRWMVICEKRP